MKLLNFKDESNKQFKLGVKTDVGILDVEKAWEAVGQSPVIPLTLEDWLKADKISLENFEDFVKGIAPKNERDLFLSEENVEFGACVPKSAKIICVGLNYKKHAEESNMTPPETPVLFNKFSNALAGHGEKVELPADSTQVDFEAELGIIIGEQAKNVTKDEALNYVAGYCNVNDLSARDLQFRTNQWLLGKSCDGFCPVGPYLVTADEVGDPNQLTIETIVNGKVRQSSNTSDMIFYCDEIISYLSHYMTLEPGDIILTGTPEGVIFGLPEHEQDWLKDGDKITIKIEKLGELTNEMKSSLNQKSESGESAVTQNV
ncbi:FAA hydrolase family protein [Bacillus aerolatus]|uniref:FAA hydrolase family protein n=1 Tax=Bacillus aerolatus TaxID=2653354 RepID=A0A6I1FKI8_9BACI|nr:fumarylacetoacetate hydrolase family protein [Bacillus aerolatus]KAB7707236.1 FAA hydrolase family protein [Bacillus aerolatus]